MRLTLARKFEAVKRKTAIKRNAIPRVCLAKPIQTDFLDKGSMEELARNENLFGPVAAPGLTGSKSKLDIKSSRARMDGLRVAMMARVLQNTDYSKQETL
jgi:hypothetical protein